MSAAKAKAAKGLFAELPSNFDNEQNRWNAFACVLFYNERSGILDLNAEATLLNASSPLFRINK